LDCRNHVVKDIDVVGDTESCFPTIENGATRDMALGSAVCGDCTGNPDLEVR
jgi:hypothetical protein